MYICVFARLIRVNALAIRARRMTQAHRANPASKPLFRLSGGLGVQSYALCNTQHTLGSGELLPCLASRAQLRSTVE